MEIVAKSQQILRKLFDPTNVADPDLGSGTFLTLDPGSVIGFFRIPDPNSFMIFVAPKNGKEKVVPPPLLGCCWIRDLGSIKIRIRNKLSGSVTLDTTMFLGGAKLKCVHNCAFLPAGRGGLVQARPTRGKPRD
jgi:hypothetical protein